jgi:hypothetical protein
MPPERLELRESHKPEAHSFEPTRTATQMGLATDTPHRQLLERVLTLLHHGTTLFTIWRTGGFSGNEVDDRWIDRSTGRKHRVERKPTYADHVCVSGYCSAFRGFRSTPHGLAQSPVPACLDAGTADV